MGVAPTGQRAHERRVTIEPGLELAPDRERLVQPRRIAERARHLGEVGRSTDRQAVAHAHVDIALRLGRARQALPHRVDGLGRLPARDR